MEADNLKQLNVYGDMQKTNALIKEFITGYEGNLTKEEEDTIKMMKDSGKVIIEKSRGEVSLVKINFILCKFLVRTLQCF